MGRAPASRKAVRYGVVSCVSLLIGQTVLALCFGVLHSSGGRANLVAMAVACLPAYYLSRMWAWGRRGRSHLLKEVLPFCTILLIGAVVPTWAASVADETGQALTDSRAQQTVVVMVATLADYAVVWVFRFLLLDAIFFSEPVPSQS